MFGAAILPTLFASLTAATVAGLKAPAKGPAVMPLTVHQAAMKGAPAVSAAGAIAIDSDSGKVLWSHDAETPRFMASCTKIMTALLLIEHGKLTDTITAPPDIEKTGESSMHLKPGEKVNVEDMLYAMMLRSANDGCVAAATYVAGSVPKFIDMMNQRARQIGCLHTHFANPNGLHDPQHFTSAHDLALIAREAMKNPVFRAIVRTQKHKIARSIDKADLWMVSRNKWLKKDLTADGIKTGYTVPAGHCYVGSASRDGWRVITVVLNSQHWQIDHQNLLNWSFSHFDSRSIAEPGTVIGSLGVREGKTAEVALTVDAPIKMAVRKGAAPPQVTALGEAVTAPVTQGQELGLVKVQDADGFTFTAKALAVAAVEKAPIGVAKAAAGKGGIAFWLGALALGGGGYALRRRAKRKMKLYGKAVVSTRSKNKDYVQGRWS